MKKSPTRPSPAGQPSATAPRRASAGLLRIAVIAALGGVAFLAAYGVARHGAGRPSGPAPVDMRWIPAGEFVMGSADQAAPANERPVHRVRLDGFWIDAQEVTNARFGAFVEATGYVTTAEKKP